VEGMTLDPKEIEKELKEFLGKKFGSQVHLAGAFPFAEAEQDEGSSEEGQGEAAEEPVDISFDLKPEELEAYLDQYIVKQDEAKEILATKICTHYNRIKLLEDHAGSSRFSGVGQIKSNILMIGPTGVGKTYMIKLIARKIGIPFVKGDATKFSEVGYVGGDVEDLVRDLVRESGGNTRLAGYGIIYIDEIDKIASSATAHGRPGRGVSTEFQRSASPSSPWGKVGDSKPAWPISRLRSDFWRLSLKVRPIAITSPTDFIWVVSVLSTPGNFSKVKRGIFVTT